MARSLRHVPEGGCLMEVTCRTIQSRFLLRPSPALNEILVGILARGQRRYGVVCHGLAFLSSHYHLLVSVADTWQLARFMNYVNSNIAREVGRLVDWRDRFWARRYEAIPVSEEEAAQAERFEYLLSQTVKEGLVARAVDWPGVHSAKALLSGVALKGLWFDRTAEWAAKNRRETFERLKYAEEETLEHAPLPCWAHLTPEQYRQRVADILERVEAQAAAALRAKGREPLGVVAIEAKDPHHRPVKQKRSPAPDFHAASKAVRKRMWEVYADFVARFRDAAEKLKAGDRTAQFPVGSFPPGLPYVNAYAYTTGPP